LENEDAARLGVDIQAPLPIRRQKSSCAADEAFIVKVEMQGIIRLYDGTIGVVGSVRRVTVC
jgi:hypothetical protein